MRIGVLGPLQVLDDAGRVVEVGGTRLRALLVLLALQPGQLVTTEALIDGLWGDDPPGGATNALQSLVSRLRKAGVEVESKPAGYLLPVAPDDVDACRFEALAAAGRYDEAEREWRGSALADVLDAPFATPVATRLEDRRLDVAEHRDLDLAHLETLAAKHPLRETLHAKLVTALATAGRQADALAAYERVRGALANELGVDPSHELAAVHLAVLRHDPSVVPTTRTKTNLRASLTSFVGRETELARVGTLLDEARLVTVFGPGGAGKTRFVTELAARWRTDTLDGVWFVELAPVTDAEDLLQAVLSAIGIRESGLLEQPSLETRAKGRDELARLIEAFSTKPALLILDNCEHLVVAAARVAETLLASCPKLRILATSREPLAILGENVFPLPPLTWPTSVDDPAVALEHSAVRLFVDRAVAVRPDFALDAANLPAVVEICERLDGMPLAIELAAARLRSLAPAQIAARLDDRFRLLTGGSRTALPRHQTLRAVVEWSWDLLDEPERVLARRLSVFPAGASLDAAEQVCAGDDLPRDDVLTTLAALVDKAILVGATGTGSDEMRYRMLETVRAYGAERLDEAAETSAVRERHAVYFRNLVESADPHLRRDDQLEWLDRLRGEYGNIIAGLRWTLDERDGSSAARYGAALMWFWFLEGNRNESMALVDEIVALPTETHPEARASVLAFHGMMLLSSDRFDEGRAVIDKAIAESRELDMTHYPLMLFLDGISSVFKRDRTAAREKLTALVGRFDGWEQAMALTFLGFLEGNEGNPDESASFLRRSFEAFATVGDRWGMAAVRRAEAADLSAIGEHEGAIAAYEEALRFVRELRSVDDVAHMMSSIGLERARMGDLDRGRVELEEALRFADEYGQAEARHMALCGLAEVEMRSDDLPRARALLHKAFSELDSNEQSAGGPPQAKAQVLIGLATADVLERDVAMASQRAREAVELGLLAFDMPIVSLAVRIDAGVALSKGSPERAAELLGLAQAVRGGPYLDDAVLHTAARTREALGDNAYERAFATGADLPRDDALARVVPTP